MWGEIHKCHSDYCEPPFLAGERSAPLSVRLRRLGEAVWRSVTEARAASSGVTLPEDLRERIDVLELVLTGAGNLDSRNTRSLLSFFPNLSMSVVHNSLSSHDWLSVRGNIIFMIRARLEEHWLPTDWTWLSRPVKAGTKGDLPRKIFCRNMIKLRRKLSKFCKVQAKDAHVTKNSFWRITYILPVKWWQ